MGIITDTFPGPTLDVAKWSDDTQGSVSYNVGTPSDGVWPIGVDDHGDLVGVNSDSKIIVPASQDFDARIMYNGMYFDAAQEILAAFGWRTIAKDGGGIPLYGIDIMLVTKPNGSTVQFEKRTLNLGSYVRSVIQPDASSGADGGLRISRAGSSYSLHHFDQAINDWVVLDVLTIPSVAVGFVQFNLEAVDPSIPFPWILQT